MLFFFTVKPLLKYVKVKSAKLLIILFRNVTTDNSTMNVDEKLGFVVNVSLTDLKSTQKDEGIHKLFVKCKITLQR